MDINRLNKFFWWLYRKPSGSFCDKFDSESKQAINEDVKKVLNKEFYEVITIDGLKAFVEWHPSIPVLIDVVKSREHNVAFKNRYASNDEDFEFTATKTYEEAVELLLKGWPTILPELENQINTNIYNYNISKKSTLHNSVVGYCPNVPNALMNLPNSMFFRELDKVENKTLHIVYCNSVGCTESTKNIIRAGSILLSAIKILELQKISVRLDLCFYSGIERTYRQCICNLIKMKDYDEQLDLLKLSFPLAHPSMLRRIGFASAETIPGPTLDFPNYGRVMTLEEHRKILHLHEDIIILNVDYVNSNSVDRLITLFKEWVG